MQWECVKIGKYFNKSEFAWNVIRLFLFWEYKIPEIINLLKLKMFYSNRIEMLNIY